MPGEKATDQNQILDLRSQNSPLQHDNADMCPIFFLKNHATLLDTITHISGTLVAHRK